MTQEMVCGSAGYIVTRLHRCKRPEGPPGRITWYLARGMSWFNKPLLGRKDGWVGGWREGGMREEGKIDG